MASFLMRVARNTSVASRAGRSRAFAATCAGRSAADRSAAGAAADRKGLQYEARDAAPCDSGVSSPDKQHKKRVVLATAPFVAEEKDLESDEAMWALYERWRKRYKQEREPEEMARRFEEFKRTAWFVHEKNNADLPYKLELNQFSDGKMKELCFMPPGVGTVQAILLMKRMSWATHE